ncbi:DUF2057 family protein [Vibrio profundi]|uniref:YccT family protein n=1 Tax=Vibrio profundi TaxID=1774960 RepID=UPI0037350662
MNLKQLACLVTASLTISVNAATLVPEKGVSILFINGQEAESKLGKNDIVDGTNQIVVRMDKEVGRGSGNKVFTSAPYVLDITVDGDVVKINHPIARSQSEAKSAFRGNSPKWRISQDGKPLDYTQEKLNGKEGVLPFMAIGELVEKHNQQRGIHFVDNKKVEATVAKAEPVSVTSTAVETPKVKLDSFEQLKAWYLQASKQERKEFRKWMIDQE